MDNGFVEKYVEIVENVKHLTCLNKFSTIQYVKYSIRQTINKMYKLTADAYAPAVFMEGKNYNK